MVGDEEVGAELHRLVDDLLDRVDGEQHTADLRIGVTADRAYGVPPFGPLGGPESVERGEDFRQYGHGWKITSRV
ncbi:putative hypothetical protein [Streptomyces sp. NBRC 110611]|nr:putative hypothetical protein [Streptomyces sp. NBRC 110611]